MVYMCLRMGRIRILPICWMFVRFGRAGISLFLTAASNDWLCFGSQSITIYHTPSVNLDLYIHLPHSMSSSAEKRQAFLDVFPSLVDELLDYMKAEHMPADAVKWYKEVSHKTNPYQSRSKLISMHSDRHSSTILLEEN